MNEPNNLNQLQQPCPYCGYCPTCGRPQFIPNYHQYPYYYQPSWVGLGNLQGHSLIQTQNIQ